MNAEQSASLRAEFPANQIHQIPRGGVLLDYVGHAEVTSRLLEVDPDWTWEPMALDPRGAPLLERNEDGVAYGMWIRLTICGVTRIGFGSVSPSAFDPEKQLIGDAIRNAGMRFGVALDLWSKSDLRDAPLPPSQFIDEDQPQQNFIDERVPIEAGPPYGWANEYKVALAETRLLNSAVDGKVIRHVLRVPENCDQEAMLRAIDQWLGIKGASVNMLMSRAVDLVNGANR